MEITPELKEKLSLLHEKYAALGEDFNAYLEGLLYADVTTYWDYIQLDTLLSLQRPKTSCLLYTSPSPRDGLLSRMPSSA